MKHFVILLAMIVGFSSCNSTKKLLTLDKTKSTFSLEKGSCLGKCSVYNLHIYPNKVAVYEGLANAERYGVYTKKLTDAEYNGLKMAFDKADYFSFNDDYPSDIIDFPLIKIGYSNNKVRKVISGKHDRPKAIIDLQLLLEDVVYSAGWELVKQYETNVTKDETNDGMRDAPQMPYIENQIIIEPNENMFLAKWMKKYEDFNVKLVKKIAPNLNLWVITFDKNKIDPKVFLETLKLDPDLKTAQFNAKVMPREH